MSASGRSAQDLPVWVLPGWEWRLGPCLFCRVAAVMQPGEQCSPVPGGVKTGQLNVSKLIFELRMAEVVTTRTDVFAAYDTFQSSLSKWLAKELPKFSFWPLEISSRRFSAFLMPWCRNCRHVLLTVIFCHGQRGLEVGVVIAALVMWWAPCELDANSWCKYHCVYHFLAPNQISSCFIMCWFPPVDFLHLR